MLQKLHQVCPWNPVFIGCKISTCCSLYSAQCPLCTLTGELLKLGQYNNIIIILSTMIKVSSLSGLLNESHPRVFKTITLSFFIAF